MIVADSAGVVAVPRDVVLEVLQRLQEHAARQADYLAGVQRGNFSNAWVDRILGEHECPVERGPLASDASDSDTSGELLAAGEYGEVTRRAEQFKRAVEAGS